jgi:tetratricopeptide (TPR) repeat protein
MSEALAAIEAGRWEAARSALDRAAELRPQAPEIADARARVDDGERRRVLSSTLERAATLEGEAAWREAEQAYRSVLERDPTNATAISGQRRVAARADLDEALAYHIDNPGRLSQDEVFEEATELLEQARMTTPADPKLDEQVRQLSEIVRWASTPIPVVLESDGLTEVVVYRVGELGRFSRRELSLRPGVYTAVGRRDGFRDVRVRIEVPTTPSGQPVLIACREVL